MLVLPPVSHVGGRGGDHGGGGCGREGRSEVAGGVVHGHEQHGGPVCRGRNIDGTLASGGERRLLPRGGWAGRRVRRVGANQVPGSDLDSGRVLTCDDRRRVL